MTAALAQVLPSTGIGPGEQKFILAPAAKPNRKGHSTWSPFRPAGPLLGNCLRGTATAPIWASKLWMVQRFHMLDL